MSQTPILRIEEYRLTQRVMAVNGLVTFSSQASGQIRSI